MLNLENKRCLLGTRPDTVNASPMYLWSANVHIFSDENNIGRKGTNLIEQAGVLRLSTMKYEGYKAGSLWMRCEIEERWRMNNKKALANERDARRTGFSPSSFCVFVALSILSLERRGRTRERERTSGGLSNYIYGCMCPELADQSYLSSESVLFLFNCSIPSQIHGL